MEQLVLEDVRFVPKLKGNFISLGTLNSTSFTINIENGIMKVIKGSLVAFKIFRKNGLYFCEGIL